MFNPGERVEGYTSPLWLAMLAAMRVLGLNLVEASGILSAALGLATLLFFPLHARRHAVGLTGAVVPALFVATNPSFVYWIWSGMDTALFTLLFSATFFRFLVEANRDRGVWGAGICFSCATLARPEMLAILPVYLVAILVQHWRSRRRLTFALVSFTAPLALVLLHLLWRLHYYGSPLPNTYYAKMGGIPLMNLLANGGSYGAHFFIAYQLYFWIALWLAALLYGRSRRETTRERLLGAGVIAVWSAYVVSVGGDHFGNFRFFVPLLPLMASLAAGSAWDLLPACGTGTRWKTVAMGVVALLAVTVLNVSIYELNGGARGREEVALARSWSEVGFWLGRHLPRRATLACVPVGAIPYFSRLTTIDLLGLTDPRIARSGKVDLGDRVGHQRYDTDYVLSRRPDYIIYQSSGVFDRPTHPGGAVHPGEFPHAFEDLATDARTRALYEYQAILLDNRRYLELLRLRPEARR